MTIPGRLGGKLLAEKCKLILQLADALKLLGNAICMTGAQPISSNRYILEGEFVNSPLQASAHRYQPVQPLSS